MARVGIFGAETGDKIEFNLAGLGAGAMNGTIQSTTKRTGGFAYRCNPAAAGAQSFALQGTAANGIYADFNVATLFASIYFRIAALPAASDIEICSFQPNGGGAPKAIVYLTPAGRVKFTTAGGVSTTGTTFTMPTGTWVHLEIKCGTSATVGPWEIKCNGTSEISGTGNLSATNNGRLWIGDMNAAAPEATDRYYDDIILDDAAYPGVGEVHILKPRAAGANAQWATGTSALFSAVNEVPHNSDTTYIGSATSGNASSFAMDSSATGGVSGTIAAVKTIGIFRDEGGASSMSVRLRNNTTNRDTTAVDPGATYVALARLDATDPNGGGAWTTGGLDTIEAGAVNSAAVAARCTALYVMVESTGNTAPTITAGPTTTYQSGTSTYNGNTWGVTFTAHDAEQTGADALTYYLRTSATFGAGTQVATGTCTSDASKVLTGLLYNASGVVDGSQTLYLHIYDGTTNTVTAGSFTLVRRIDTVCLPTAASLTITPTTPAIKLGTNVLPSAASLALSPTTPAVVLAVKVLPTAATLALTLSTPAVVVVTNTSALPTVVSLVLTPSTPAVAFTANAYPQPSAASLTLTLSTPAVVQDTTILPSAATLSLSPSTPVVILGTNVLPSAATLTLTLSTPGVVLAVKVLPSAASLALSLSTPAVVYTANTLLLPLAAMLLLTLSTPLVQRTVYAWRPPAGFGRFERTPPAGFGRFERTPPAGR